MRPAFPGDLENVGWGRGVKAFISGDQGNNDLQSRGTAEQRKSLVIWNIRNQTIYFGEQAARRFISAEQRWMYPSRRLSTLKLMCCFTFLRMIFRG